MSTTPPPPPTPPVTNASSQGLVKRVFDLSFSEFVTPSIIKFLFVLGIIGSALVSVIVLVAFATQGGAAVVVGLILAPLIFIAYVLVVRVISELYLLLFRIEENTRPRK